ncbi:MAG: ArsR/SmtB family transcription factor [Acidimicrobiales bacterium]
MRTSLIEIPELVQTITAACDANRPRLAERPLVPPRLAARTARLFKVLANDTRLRLLHELVRTKESNVTELSAAAGLPPQAVSNQLQRLVDQGVVASRREGNFVYYHLADPCTAALLDLGLCMAEMLEAAKPSDEPRWRP